VNEHPAGAAVEATKRSRARSGVRQLTRLAALVAAVVLVCAAPELWSVFVPAISPLVAAALVLATWTLPAFAVPALVIALVTCWRHRWFCHWVCPTGCCADGTAWLGGRCGRRLRRLPVLGPALALIILAGACLGYPVLLWLDPLALLSNSVGRFDNRAASALSWGLLGFAFILIVSAGWPHAWCARLCPLGGLQDVLAAAASQLLRTVRWCLPRSRALSRARPVSGLLRRSFLGGATGLAWATCLARWNPARERPLRPPGAAEEERFASLCLRCGNCVRACPAGIIQADTGKYGIGGFLAPLITYDSNYCWELCVQCTRACPSGAIVPVALPHKVQAAIGVPVVDMDVCLLGAVRECAVCRNHCPYAAIRLVFDEQEYTLTPRVDLRRCNGCGACQVACPTQPRKAIVVRPA
jgi:ferredoxin-type protein NapF